MFFSMVNCLSERYIIQVNNYQFYPYYTCYTDSTFFSTNKYLNYHNEPGHLTLKTPKTAPRCDEWDWNIYPYFKYMVHVSKYTIHGCYGLGQISIFWQVSTEVYCIWLKFMVENRMYIFQSHGAYTLENEHFEPEKITPLKLENHLNQSCKFGFHVSFRQCTNQ